MQSKKRADSLSRECDKRQKLKPSQRQKKTIVFLLKSYPLPLLLHWWLMAIVVFQFFSLSCLFQCFNNAFSFHYSRISRNEQWKVTATATPAQHHTTMKTIFMQKKSQRRCWRGKLNNFLTGRARMKRTAQCHTKTWDKKWKKEVKKKIFVVDKGHGIT